MDTELMAEVARLRPNWHWVMLGIKSNLVQVTAPNIHFLGSKPYSELPRYIRQFDVCVLPWRESNTFTGYGSAIKVREYLATGKPVVMAPLFEYLETPGLRFYRGVQQFIEQVEAALANDTPCSRQTPGCGEGRNVGCASATACSADSGAAARDRRAKGGAMRALLEDMKSGEIAAHEIPAPELRDGGILVRTAFSAISAGTEKATVEAGRKSLLGKALARPDLVKQVFAYARSNGVTAARQKVQARLDTLNALGYSCSGFVLEARAEGFRPGDRVACAGVGYASHSEINFVPANLAVLIPQNVSLEAASLTTIGAIAVHGVRQASVTFGETVAVIGAGLVGVLTMQVLRAAGCRVVAIDLSDERAQKATDLGAHLGLSLNDPGLESSIASFSRYGVDAVIITAATKSAEPLELAAKLLRDRGRISVVGDVGMGVSRALMYRKEISLTMSRSYGPGRYDPDYEEGGHDYPIGYVRWTEKRNMEAFLDLLSSGAIEIKPLLAHMYAVEDGATAYAAVEGGAYTGIIDYHAPADGEFTEKRPPRVAAPHQRTPGTLRVGCIGAGGFARGVIFPHLRSSKGIKLQSVASSTGAAAVSARSGFGFEAAEAPSELIANPSVDGVFILTRHDSHAEYVRAAIDIGKAVFVEKPLAVNRAQLETIRTAYATALAEGRSPFLMVGFNRRFSPLTEKLRLSSPDAARRCWSTFAVMADSFLGIAGFRSPHKEDGLSVSCAILSIGRGRSLALPCDESWRLLCRMQTATAETT